jgi:hypothetical protein
VVTLHPRTVTVRATAVGEPVDLVVMRLAVRHLGKTNMERKSFTVRKTCQCRKYLLSLWNPKWVSWTAQPVKVMNGR